MEKSREWKKLVTDKYHSTKFLALFTQVLGSNGIAFQGIYSYLKWVDNNVDETDWSMSEKYEFLTRQGIIIKSINEEIEIPKYLNDQEENFLSLPWNTYGSKDKKLIGEMISNIVTTNVIDVNHMDLSAKSEEDINSYAGLLLISCLRLASLLINHKDLVHNEKSIQPMTESWFALGSLNDLVEDLDSKMFHLALTEGEIKKINELEIDDRRGLIENILNKDRFDKIKQENLRKLLKSSFAFMETNMPWWQKIGSTLFNFEILINHGFLKKNPNLGSTDK